MIKDRRILKRTTVISTIRGIHSMALHVTNAPAIIPAFLLSVDDLDTLWSQFEAEDNSVLDFLVMLGTMSEYSAIFLLKCMVS